MLTSLVTALVVGFGGHVGPQGEDSVVLAQGSASITVKADAANLSFLVKTKAKTIKEAAAIADTEWFGMSKKLAADYPLVSKAERSEPTFQPIFDGTNALPGRNAITSYEYFASWSLNRVPLSRVETLLKRAQGSETVFASVSSYGLKEDDSARKQVLRLAYEDALQKANEVAQAAGLRIGSVAYLDPGQGVQFQPGYEVTSMNSGQVGSSTEPTKNMKVSTSITVKFKLVK